ncbi:putative ABC transporter permease [Enorma phocaeensis]|uniref:ABC transporter permease n=1 Tax=Enorma phocaeensis TaxID=1871019 RepID=A0ABT7VAR8_9ACTN|nr:putative ABC transporter permease [Enorma phocaeensis]MDM8275602.1 putative ABC transporter permease [Enorma phocaeensis]
MTDQSTGERAVLKDYDLPGNDLDPNTTTPEQRKKISLIAKVYGLLCLIDGIVTLPVAVIFIGMVVWALQSRPDLISVGQDPTLTTILMVMSFVVTVVTAGVLIFFGISILRNHRRNAARWSHVLLALNLTQFLFSIMLQGIGEHLIAPFIQLVILLALSVTVDPSLRQERRLRRRLRDLEEREAAEAGLLGRDLKGRGYIQLNFFNIFWVFVVCSVLGLIIEVIWHMVVVDPGVYQDRAGMLFGPFSPIYGVGAVLMTVALNRFYRSNPLIIFVVSAVIGGLFEAFVSWFMQTGFGAVAWDYTGTTLFGIPDPVAIIFGGRTSTPFMCMWGLLGFVWIKLCLPRLLKLINMIPWKMRYSLTTLCALLMMVNAVMTLQSLDCWFERVSGIEPTSPVEEFYAKNFDNSYMEHRFQSMTITPEDSNRVDSSKVAEAVGQPSA